MTIYVACFHPTKLNCVEYIREYEEASEVPEGSQIVSPWLGIPPSPAFTGELRLAQGALYWHDPRTLDQAKADKREQINQWWLAANRLGFTFGGKQIRMADELDQWNLNGTNGTVVLTGDFPPGWDGSWKAADNTYVSIPDVATWKAFYSAMAAQGAANFTTAQLLKAQLTAAQTMAEVEAVVWPA